MKVIDILEDANPIVKIILILLLQKNKEKIPGKLWLQKELYVILKNLKTVTTEEIYEPHLLGQYSEDAEVAVEQIGMMGLLDPMEKGFILSEKGEKVAKEALKEFSQEALQFIEEIKVFLNDMKKNELLGYIYYTYPEMAVNSIKKQEIEQKRVEIALQLYLKEKISIGKAVEIAGIKRIDLIKLLRKKDSSLEIYAK